MITFKDISKIDPEQINYTCSPRHIQSVIEDLIEEICRLQSVKSGESLQLLTDLTNALDKAFISTWQSTASWQKELDAALKYIEQNGVGTMTTQPTKSDYESAAMAAGIKLLWACNNTVAIAPDTTFWKPYDNAADAFRLMTTCGLFVKCKSNSVQVCVPHGKWMTFFHNDDNLEEVTRHAIFWAAVVAGKQMKEV